VSGTIRYLCVQAGQSGLYRGRLIFEPWFSVKEALGTIVRFREVGPREAENLLITACRSRRVRSRYLAFWKGRTIVMTGNLYLDRYLADLDDDKPRTRVQLGEDLIDPRRLQMEYRAIHASRWAVDQPGFIDLKGWKKEPSTGAFPAEGQPSDCENFEGDDAAALTRCGKANAPAGCPAYGPVGTRTGRPVHRHALSVQRLRAENPRCENFIAALLGPGLKPDQYPAV
jgi:hypothetical protein